MSGDFDSDEINGPVLDNDEQEPPRSQETAVSRSRASASGSGNGSSGLWNQRRL
jgi:hypothetical protein